MSGKSSADYAREAYETAIASLQELVPTQYDYLEAHWPEEWRVATRKCVAAIQSIRTNGGKL